MSMSVKMSVSYPSLSDDVSVTSTDTMFGVPDIASLRFVQKMKALALKTFEFKKETFKSYKFIKSIFFFFFFVLISFIFSSIQSTEQIVRIPRRRQKLLRRTNPGHQEYVGGGDDGHHALTISRSS